MFGLQQSRRANKRITRVIKFLEETFGGEVTEYEGLDEIAWYPTLGHKKSRIDTTQELYRAEIKDLIEKVDALANYCKVEFIPPKSQKKVTWTAKKKK